MAYTLSDNAHAVLLPAFDGVELTDTTRRFLDRGGVSILIGESRAEYVARTMDDLRRATETAEDISRLVDNAAARSGLLLTAIDQELGGICRLHDLVPQFPAKPEITTTSEGDIEAVSRHIAELAVGMGVNVFLAPILDVLTGSNPWLEGRTYSADPEFVARLSAAYVRGVQAGRVAATGKHYPGFGNITGDPAIDPDAVDMSSADELRAGEIPFRAAIAAGVEMIMVGPAIVAAHDPAKAALRSATIVARLRNELGFSGIVMADDLDSKATMRSDDVPTVAIDALNAGCDFLLLADVDDQLEHVASAIVRAAETGAISQEALAASADRVRGLAATYATARTNL